MTRLELEGLVLRQGRLTSIDWRGGSPLEVAPGELVTLVGKSGAGKSVLARVIGGLDTLDEGTIRIDGTVATRLPPQDRGVAIIFEGDGLWAHWNVAQNVAFGLKCRGMGRTERRSRVDEVLASVRLDGLGRRRIESLSALQRWRVALARALVLDPKLLVIDEPFGVSNGEMDAVTLAQEIHRVHSEHGQTTLLLTREGPPSMAIADRIGVLSVGGLVQVGRPTEIYTRPRSLEIAEMFGSITTIPGRLERVDPTGDALVHTALGRLTGRCRPDTLSVGADVVMLARPESFVVPASNAFANRFTAAVLGRRVEGSLCRVELRGLGDWTGAATLLRPAASALHDGQSLAVAIPPDGVFVVPGAG